MVLAGHGHDYAWSSPLSTAARALVAVEAIDPEAVEAVLDDYGSALALRDGEFEHYPMRARRPGPPAAPAELPPRRVVPCDRAIDKGGETLHVRSVSLDDDSTTLAITYLMKPPPLRRRHGGMAMLVGRGPFFGPGGPLQQVTVADDRGTKVGTQFSGGGSDWEWRGHLHADAPLAKDTAWIEVDGERIELEDAPPAGEVVIEALEDQPRALRYLWGLVATYDDFHGPPTVLEPAIEALVAAGALDADDSSLRDVRAVASMIDPHRRAPGARRVRRLPEPWRSLLARRGRTDGPSGTAAIGLVTPRFDGIVVAAISLESHGEGFEVEVEVAPDTVMYHGFEEPGLGPTLAWWARDDRGNHYLGTAAGWSGGEGRGRGDISFNPALDPEATRLELMPTAGTSRAVISFPLPWPTGDRSE
jgi:hypothetical protein